MRRVVVSILSGLLLTYLSGWAALLWQDNSESRLVPRPAISGLYAWPEAPPPAWPSSPDSVEVSGRGGVCIYEFAAAVEVPRLPAPARASISGVTTFRDLGMTVLTTGFPFHALQSQWRGNGRAESPSLSRGVARPTWIPSKWSLAPFLPIQPVWIGLLANWSTYSLLSMLGLYGVCAARRRFRSRRGLCPKCAYQVPSTTPVCPECGDGNGARSA